MKGEGEEDFGRVEYLKRIEKISVVHSRMGD